MNIQYLFVFSEFITNITRSALFIYTSIVIINLTNGVGWVLVLLFIETSFLFVAPLIAGSLIDKKTSSYVLTRVTLLIFLLLILLYLISIFTKINTQIILILFTMVMSIASPFIKQGVFVLTTSVFSKGIINRGNSLIGIAMQVGQLSGILLAPIFIAILQPQNLILLYLFIYIMLFYIYKYIASCVQQNIEEQIVSKTNIFSFFYEFFNKGIVKKVVFASSLDMLLVAIFNVMLVITINELFNKQGLWMSVFDGVFAISAIFAGVIIAKRNTNIKPIFVYLSLISFSFIFISLLFTQTIYFSIIFCGIWGYCLTNSNVFWKSKLQTEVPKNKLGKLSGLRGFTVAIASAIITPLIYFIYKINFTSIIIFIITIVIIFIIFILLSRSTKTNTFSNFNN